MRKFRITVDGTAYEVCVEELDAGISAPPATPRPPAEQVTARRPATAGASTPPPSLPAAAAGDIASPLAATVVKVEVAVGQQVTAGQELAVLEAMKMNNFVHAPREGTVSAIHVAAGDVVVEGQPLLTLA